MSSSFQGKEICVGTLHVYPGPMFSGKTTRLTKEITHFADVTNGFQQFISFDCAPIIVSRPLLINHVLDNRNKIGVSSHSTQFKISGSIDIIQRSKLADAEEAVKYRNVIGIDECHWFPDLVSMVLKWMKTGKHIYVAGLDGTWEMKPFGDIKELVVYATTFTKLCSVCKDCFKDLVDSGVTVTPDMFASISAPYTSRIVSDTATTLIGGADKYTPTCWKHYHVRKFDSEVSKDDLLSL